ncbi:MAG: nucleotide sugar dehydrogenase [Anaerolineae bacterium]
MSLVDKIESRQAKVAVIGLGYVGLPLAVAFAEAGFHVIGIDIDKERVAAINRGQSYVSDVPSEKLAPLVTAAVNSEQLSVISEQLKRDPQSAIRNPKSDIGRLSATTDYDALYEVDAVIICVPTPLGKTKDPDMSYIISATDEIARRLHRDMLIVLESTTYPGTTEELILPRLEAETGGQGDKRTGRQGAGEHGSKGAEGPGSMGAGALGRRGATGDGKAPAWTKTNPQSATCAEPSRSIPNPKSEIRNPKLEVGYDFFLAFSPERIDPGRTDYTIHNTPKVIGGVTARCLEVARALYECAIEEVVAVSSPRVAEMVKLLENTFRAVNIALVNEVAIMCDRLGIDVWEVIEAARTKPFGFMPFYPGPGLGGHCIPIDPQYLAWKLKTLNYNARFIQLAAEINFGMPQYVLGKIADALNEAGKPINGSRVLILGVAYKADVGDLRESPALDLTHLLREKGADVQYHDPYVPKLNEDGIVLTGVPLDAHALQSADCVVITAAHSSYDWGWIVNNSQLIVDTRNATKGVGENTTRVVSL